MTKKYVLTIIISLSFLLFNFCGKHNDSSSIQPQAVGQVQEQPPGKPGKGLQLRQQHRKRQRNGRISIVTLSGEEKKYIQIKTVTVKENPIRSTLKAMGKVQASPEAKAIVGYAFPGRITNIHVSIGQWVEKGQSLVTLECEDVGNAKSDYFKALTEYNLAKQNFQREERLFKKDIGAQKDYLETRAQLDIARSNLDAAEKKLQVMGFSQNQVDELANGKNITPYVTVNAPIDGRVVENNAVLGAMIETTTEIMVVLNPQTLCIDAEIYEKDLAKIKSRQEVRIAVPAYPGETFVGQISYIGDLVHPETRTITVRTRVSNKDLRLKPGMFADINILVDQRTSAVTVPVEAVLIDVDRKIIFVKEGDNYLCRIVEVGPTFNGHIEIVKGVKTGEIVVVEGNYQLKSRLHEETLKRAHVH